MTRTACRLMFALLTLSLSAALLAQDELLNEAQSDIRLYSVEIVVFRYAENISVGSEVFPPDPLDPAGDETESIAEVEVQAARRRDPDFVGLKSGPLPADQFTLQGVFDKLELLDAYDPVLHVGWIQPGLPQSDTVVMQVADFAGAPADLDGSFTLYLSRYLHLVVDLALAAPVAVAEFVNEYGAVRPFEYALTPTEGPVHFRIQEDRIFKNGEIRYYDHPKFGVVAKVLRVESGLQQGVQEITR